MNGLPKGSLFTSTRSYIQHWLLLLLMALVSAHRASLFPVQYNMAYFCFVWFFSLFEYTFGGLRLCFYSTSLGRMLICKSFTRVCCITGFGDLLHNFLYLFFSLFLLMLVIAFLLSEKSRTVKNGEQYCWEDRHVGVQNVGFLLPCFILQHPLLSCISIHLRIKVEVSTPGEKLFNCRRRKRLGLSHLTRFAHAFLWVLGIP